MYCLDDAIQYGVLCLEPYGGTAKDGALLILWRTCSTPNKRFIFPNIGVFLFLFTLFKKIPSLFETLDSYGTYFERACKVYRAFVCLQN